MLDRAVEEHNTIQETGSVVRPSRRRAPAWFRGTAGAANTSIMAARQLGFNVQTPQELT